MGAMDMIPPAYPEPYGSGRIPDHSRPGKDFSLRCGKNVRLPIDFEAVAGITALQFSQPALFDFHHLLRTIDLARIQRYLFQRTGPMGDAAQGNQDTMTA
jgi:hypothetical protein